MWILKSTHSCHFLLQNKNVILWCCNETESHWSDDSWFRLYKIYDDSANHNSQTKLFYVTVIKTYTIALGELGTMQITRGQMFLFLRFSTSRLFSGSRQCMPWKIQIKQKKSYHSMEGLTWVTKKLWQRIRKDAWLEHLLHNLIYGALHTSPVASFPGPAQLSVAWSREKWESGWYLITWRWTERMAERMIERVW